MTRLVDLSMPVHRGMVTFPRISPPMLLMYETWQEFAEGIGAAKHGADWLTASYMVIQSDHVGTHCDAVKHILRVHNPRVRWHRSEYEAVRNASLRRARRHYPFTMATKMLLTYR